VHPTVAICALAAIHRNTPVQVAVPDPVAPTPTVLRFGDERGPGETPGPPSQGRSSYPPQAPSPRQPPVTNPPGRREDFHPRGLESKRAGTGPSTKIHKILGFGGAPTTSPRGSVGFRVAGSGAVPEGSGVKPASSVTARKTTVDASRRNRVNGGVDSAPAGTRAHR
jgi:hypothetical protein